MLVNTNIQKVCYVFVFFCVSAAVLRVGNQATWELCAVTLFPTVPETSFVKASWHPLSDAHLGILSSDGTWCLVNLTCGASVSDPELYFKAFESKQEEAVDFVFSFGCLGKNPSPEEAWLQLSVFFLSSFGRVSLRSPVLPSVAAMPQAMLHALAADPNEWLQESLLAGQAFDILDSSVCVARHRLHLHGKGPYVPAEQMLEEAREGPQSPQSARHAQSPFCSMQLLTQSPLVLLVRATTSGLIQLVALEAAPGPAFLKKGVAASVLEEIDLMCSTTSLGMMCLSKDPFPSFLAHSNSLVAVVDVNWARQDTGTLLPSTITTLAEIRSQDATEFAGLQPLAGRALLLRVEQTPRSSMKLQLLEYVRQGRSAERERRERPSSSLKRLLLAPLPQEAREVSRETQHLARATSQLRAQLANILPRKDLLQHLADALPSRFEAVSDSESLGRRAQEAAGRCEAVRLRQEALRQRQERLAAALQAELELMALNASNHALVRLFARFYELRRAANLLKSGLQKNVSKESSGTACVRANATRSCWASTADHLRLQAAEAEATVDLAAARWP